MGNLKPIDEKNCGVPVVITLKSGASIFGWARARLTGSESEEELKAHPLAKDPMYWLVKDLMSRAFPIVQRAEIKRRIADILEKLTESERGIVLADLIADNQMLSGQGFNSESMSIILYCGEELKIVKGAFLLSEFAGVHCSDIKLL